MPTRLRQSHNLTEGRQIIEDFHINPIRGEDEYQLVFDVPSTTNPNWYVRVKLCRADILKLQSLVSIGHPMCAATYTTQWYDLEAQGVLVCAYSVARLKPPEILWAAYSVEHAQWVITQPRLIERITSCWLMRNTEPVGYAAHITPPTIRGKQASQ